MFTVYGYGRASTDHQQMSTGQQHSVCQEQFHILTRVKPDWSDAIWGGWYADEATARTSEFRVRHQASLMLALCKPGDVVISAKFDRTFVNAADVHNTLKYFNDSRIRLKVLDIDIDTTNPLGECVFKILAAVKELEVNEIRARNRAAATHRRAVGRPTSKPPFGYRNVRVQRAGGKLESYLVEDQAKRRFADELFAIARQHNAGCRAAAKLFNEMGIKQPGTHRTWKPKIVWRWLDAAEHGFPLPNGTRTPAPIPPDGVIVEMKEVNPDR